MFSMSVSVIIVQIFTIIIYYLNPEILQKPYRKGMHIYISLLMVVLIGGLQQFMEDTGPYGNPVNWAHSLIFAINSILMAILPTKKNIKG